LRTSFSQEIFIFPKKISLFFPWENRNPLENWSFQTSLDFFPKICAYLSLRGHKKKWIGIGLIEGRIFLSIVRAGLGPEPEKS
jgi:hypothetical protein